MKARAFLGCFAAASLWGCGHETVVGPDRWEVIWQMHGDRALTMTSSPDGALFISTFEGRVFRNIPDEGSQWEALPEVPAASIGDGRLEFLFAPTRDVLFGGQGPRLFTWRDGGTFAQQDLPISAAHVSCGDFFTTEQINAIWGKTESDVYAVGDHGLILHFDGTAWELVPNLLREQAPSLCYQAFETDLYAVGGNDAAVFAAGWTFIRRSGDGLWSRIDRPEGEGTGGAFRSIVPHENAMLFAGWEFQRFGDSPPYTFAHPGRLFRFDTEGWQVWNDKVENLPTLWGASSHPGNPVVLWNTRGEITVLDGHSRSTHRFPGSGQTRSAEIVRGQLYVFASRDGAAVVVRLR